MGAIGKFFDKHPLLACGALLVGLAALSASSDGEGELRTHERSEA